ncbi:MAG: hypothetical protein MUO52_09140, partial [Desulfobacterales bacterium]|nr:hypothetical protein [Desulfobacterales bacterium]
CRSYRRVPRSCGSIERANIDEKDQQVLYRWQLEWPFFEKGHEGRPEKRRGVDVLHFQEGKIVKKLIYCKTTIEIDGQRHPLLPCGG